MTDSSSSSVKVWMADSSSLNGSDSIPPRWHSVLVRTNRGRSRLVGAGTGPVFTRLFPFTVEPVCFGCSWDFGATVLSFSLLLVPLVSSLGRLTAKEGVMGKFLG